MTCQCQRDNNDNEEDGGGDDDGIITKMMMMKMMVIIMALRGIVVDILQISQLRCELFQACTRKWQ